MESREAPAGAGNSGGVSGGYSFFAHFNPLSQQQRLAAHEILPGLFLGSAMAARSASWLQQNGITHIVCVHNSQASPQKLREEMLEQNAQRRAILRVHPEREAEKLQSEQRRLVELQRQQIVQHVAVYADRYVYCCCHAVDDPSELVLPSLPLCIAFIEKALADRTYRMHSPGYSASMEAADCASRGLPPHNVRLLQSRRRNHVFVEKGRAVDTYDFAEDCLLDYKVPVDDGARQADVAALEGRCKAMSDGRDEKATEREGASSASILQSRSGGRVLVHCAKGISRSACVVLAFLLYRKCLRFQDALAFLRSKRPVYPNVGFQVQLKFLEERLEEVRPALPHEVEADRRNRETTKTQKAGGASAPASLGFDSEVSIETSEPDIFLRDPTAKPRLRAFLAKAATELDSAELQERVQDRVLAECAAVEEKVGALYSRTNLLQQRELWGPFGLFFENLRSYQLLQKETVLKRAQDAAKKAAELKLVFAATLPGVSVADQVANEINLWVSDCRRIASSASTPSASQTQSEGARLVSEVDRKNTDAASTQQKARSQTSVEEEGRRFLSPERKHSRSSVEKSRDAAIQKHRAEHIRTSRSPSSSSRHSREDTRNDDARKKKSKRGRDSDWASPSRKEAKRKKKAKKEHKKAKLRLRFKQRNDRNLDGKSRTTTSRSRSNSSELT